MVETMLLEQKDLREQAIGRIEVLGKVKELFLIPKMEVMTVKQVAEYFEVPLEAIQSCYKDNKNEIDTDGVILKPYKDFLIVLQKQLESTVKGKAIFRIAEDMTLEIPNRGIKCFPKRAILRMAMLLRDSTVAREIRTQLLNTFEQATPEQRTADIDEETAIMMEIGRAAMTGDIQQVNLAYAKAFAFKNRHIKVLEDSNQELTDNNQELANDNKALAGEILHWTDRACLNKAIRIFAIRTSSSFGSAWHYLYNELRYKHSIGLTQRGKAPYIQYIREDEWGAVQQSLAAMCEDNGISVSKLMERAKMEWISEQDQAA